MMVFFSFFFHLKNDLSIIRTILAEARYDLKICFEDDVRNNSDDFLVRLCLLQRELQYLRKCTDQKSLSNWQFSCLIFHKTIFWVVQHQEASVTAPILPISNEILTNTSNNACPFYQNKMLPVFSFESFSFRCSMNGMASEKWATTFVW